MKVSTAASVVIAAEFERARLIVGTPPPTINLDTWSRSAFSTLYGMGFFEAVGLSKAASARFVDRHGNITMQIQSGSTGDRLEQAADALEALLSEAFDSEGIRVDGSNVQLEALEALLFWINTSVSEALTNVSNWAYEGVAPRGPQQWWVAATYAPVTGSLTVVVYDQGITIPTSLSKRDWYQDMIAKLRAFWGANDEVSSWTSSRWIAAALEYGRSKSRQDNRGKGLPQMADILDHCPAGSLRIVSGTGSCYLEKGQPLREEEGLTMPISGTLIEWKLSLPVLS